ncbi:protein Diedel [Drosophila mojavensis]|uniref:protein Diedel n=1 Tax=Drosophila mojavensis TaxID=7230 RepID=UPI00017CA24B|nr:protein Diedel [Drosophila mojavensis]
MLQFSCLIAVLGVLWLLVLQAPDASAVCCAEAKVVKYKVLNGQCAAIRGQRSDDGNCVIKICGDGRPLRGTYCGRGSCNLAGCDCDGGCLPGDWEKSLVSDTGIYRVEILEIYWQDLSIFRIPSQSIWDLAASVIGGPKK